MKKDPFFVKRLFIFAFFSFGLICFSMSASAQEIFTANSTETNFSNHPTIRGFDPLAVSSPNDPFPDTTDPCCFLESSTQFGNGVPEGSSTSLIEQRRVSAVSSAELFSRGSILSGPSAVSGQRANHIESGFDQSVGQQGQIFNIAFSIDSVTDSDGNLVGQATGTFAQVVRDPVSTQGLTRVCSGSFTYDETLGFVLTAGPGTQC